MDIDFKRIGLAAKDIVFGLGAAAAGAQGGPAAAEGVKKVGGIVDNLIGVEPPPPEPKPSRADKFDRTDFSARPRKAIPVSAPIAAPVAEEDAAAPVDVDAQTTASFLIARGWSAEKVQALLRGPQVAAEETTADEKKPEEAQIITLSQKEEPSKKEAPAPKLGHVEDIIYFGKRR